MDAYETLCRTVVAQPSRRGVARALAGLAGSGVLAAVLGVTDAEAKKRKKKKKKKKQPEAQVTLCVNGQTLTVPESVALSLLAQGATYGACPPSPPPSPPPPPPPAPNSSFTATPMTKGAVTPACASAGANAQGQADFTIQGATICGTFQASGLSGAAIGKHVRTGVAGVNGSLALDFSAAALDEQLCLPCPGTVCADIAANPAAFYA